MRSPARVLSSTESGGVPATPALSLLRRPPSAEGWLRSVTFVSALSLWALVTGHWSTWQAARVEVAQQKQIEKEQKEPVEERVVEAIVKETELEPTANGSV